MSGTSTGKGRIRGQLPEGTPVAHKTGTSDTNKQGITAAINDIGIVTLPDGRHFAIGIFVSNSKENEATNEKIIADITKLAWDYFVNKPK
jgi:beta-lactamase class A